LCLIGKKEKYKEVLISNGIAWEEEAYGGFNLKCSDEESWNS
jgi:hypothetical protein